MLTDYDEFPVHQYSRPFSELPSNELNWDDGYYFGVYNAAAKVFMYTGMRVTPNADMIGCYAGVSVAGKQTTVRASRIWRPDFSTRVGPLGYQVREAYRDIQLTLEPNESGVSFDLRWIGIAPPHEEAHHFAQNRGRVTTDQTRYSQSGTAEGWIEVDGVRYEVTPFDWYADRDHSWGLYEPRAPLSDPREWLPPPERSAEERFFRFWMPFQTPDYSGFYHFHENERGEQQRLNDVFGTPFEGAVDSGFDGERLAFVRGTHQLEFFPGTRVIERGEIDLVDAHGREWHQTLTTASMPWTTFPIGYYLGTWRDGGNIHTYHGGADVYVEHDVIDFSSQPADHRTYDGRQYTGIYGAEYLVSVQTDGPFGPAEGLGHIEFFMHRKYQRYQPKDPRS